MAQAKTISHLQANRIEAQPAKTGEAIKAPVVLKREFIKPVEVGTSGAERDAALTSHMAVAAHANEKYDKFLAGGKGEKEIRESTADMEIATYAQIVRASSDFKEPIDLSTGAELRVDLEGSKPSLEKDKGTRITSITGKEGDNFVCQTDKGEKKISASLIITQQLIASYRDGKGVRDQFSPAEQKIIDAYLESLAGKKEAAEKIDKKELREVALKSGLVSSESVIAFGNSKENRKEVKAEDLAEGADAGKKTTALANQEYNARIDRALEKMKDTMVASPEVLDEICQIIMPDKINGSDSFISVEMTTIKAQIEEYNQKDPKNPKKTELEKSLTELTNFKALLTEAQDHFTQEGHVFENFLGQVQRGEVETTTAQALDAAIKNNDAQGMLGVLLTDKNVDPSKLQKILKKIDLKTIAKYGGGVSLGIFFMLLWKAIKGEGGMMGAAAAG